MASQWSFLTPEAAAVSVVAAIGAKFLYSYYNTGTATEQRYIPFAKDFPDNEEVLVVDCTHPTAVTLSHHRNVRNPAGLKPSDTSTGLVLNALRSSYGWNKEVAAALAKPFVSTNHFDIDSFLSVWCLLNRSLALQHEAVLRHMARIGDFREAFLSPDLITAHGAEDNITFIREAYTALKLCCWINTLERRLFSAPYEARDCDTKMDWFLPRFVLVLQDPESVWGDWQQEYTQVVSGFDLLSGGDCLVETFPEVGLAAVSAPEPLHYYSLFSHTIGCDVVLSMYDGQRYEVECKYHQFVVTCGRPVWPRLDLTPLAALLNQMEDKEGPHPLPEEEGGNQEVQAALTWSATRFTDTGPLLRLERAGERLTKAQRYGHPCDRPIYSSSITPSKMQAIVQSFFEFGLQGLRPQVGGLDWRQLHELNEAIAWQDWASCILEQHQRGALDMDRWLTERASRRRASVAASNGGVTPPLTPVSDAAGSPPPASARAPPHPTTVWSPPPPSAAGGRPEVSQGLSVPGTGMPAVGFLPALHGAAHLLTPGHAQALAGVLPPLYRSSDWTLLYSTHNDGTSLHTLLRKAAHAAPTVLLVRDSSGGLFGAYAAEPWRPATRFFGTGETFVFQLEPKRMMWPWLSRPGVRNDFFQYATQECLAVGGGGHWAVYLDEELSAGSSGACDTFGSPSLSGTPDFGVMAVELWGVSSHVVPG